MIKQSILIIDPDKATQGWLTAILNKAGYITTCVESGNEALSHIAESTPDLIIMELLLPDMQGMEVFNNLRQKTATQEIPVIILSRKDNPEDIAASLSVGVNDYIIKRPGADRELLGKCANLLGKGRPISKPLPVGHIITFFSAKGGTGTSTLCVNLAHMISRLVDPKTVLVADLVLPLGSISMMVGASEKEHISKLTNDLRPFDFTVLKEYLEVVPQWNFTVLRGSPDPINAQELKSKRIPSLFDALTLMYDYIFVDVGRNLSRVSLPILQRSNVIVIMLGPDLVTVEHTEASIGYFHQEHIPDDKLFLLMNRAVGREGLTKTEIESRLGLKIKGTVPYTQDNFTLATNMKQPYATRFTDGTSLVLNNLAQMLRAHVKATS